MSMSSIPFRHVVGKMTVSGYVALRQSDERFFVSDPSHPPPSIEIAFSDDRRIDARLLRSGREGQLKIAYTGKEGDPFRKWLKQIFKPRGRNRPRGILVLEKTGPAQYAATAESIRQAQVDVLELGKRHYFEGAKPLSILHPALLGLEDVVRKVILPPPVATPFVRERIEKTLRDVGWEAGGSPGGGISQTCGLRRSSAELHVVLEAGDLPMALLSTAIGFHFRAIDLGVLLVADGAFTSRIRSGSSGSAASVERSLREIAALPFLVRGPICLISLGMKRVLR
jgi:hypothetical protein